MDHLEEELTCAICYDIFEDPRVLPCSHTFCRACVQGLLQLSPEFSTGRGLSCPSCRARVAVPAAGPESLPINFALKAVIEKCQHEKGAGAGAGAGMCRTHPRQPLNVYCVQDKQLVCGQCLTIGKHRGHPIDDLQSAYRKAREDLGKLLEELTDKSEVSLCIKRLQQHKARCQRALESDREAVLKYFNELGDALEYKKAAVLSILDELNSSISEEYSPLLEEVEKLKLEESELKQLHSAVQKEESPLLFLEKLEGLQQRLHALKHKQLPETEPVDIHPRVENLIKHVWSKTAIGQVDKLPTPQLQLIHRIKYKPKSKLQPMEMCAMAMMILFTLVIVWLQETPPALMPAPLADLRESVLQRFRDYRVYLQNTVRELCHTSDKMMRFCHKIIPE
ncbi:TRI59 protein, partial [Pardalotus punctatus]|nr:TRI59 protein [Pardalotus punctatus]